MSPHVGFKLIHFNSQLQGVLPCIAIASASIAYNAVRNVHILGSGITRYGLIILHFPVWVIFVAAEVSQGIWPPLQPLSLEFPPLLRP
jgi:hypothetical protein